MPYLYILFSPSRNRYYIGSTIDLERRFSEHQRRQTTSTRSGYPWQLVYSRQFKTYRDASHAERNLKKQKSRLIIERLIQDARVG